MGQVYDLNDLLLDPFWEVDANSALLKKFIQFNEDNIQNEVKTLKEDLPKAVQYGMSDNVDVVKKFVGDTIMQVGKITEVNVFFRQRLRQSIIIQLYVFMESYLTKQCDIHWQANQNGKQLRYQDGQGELNKIKSYYKNSLGIDITKDNKQWVFILNLKELRNKIAHSQGKFSDVKTYNKLLPLSGPASYSIIKENLTSSYSIQLQEKFIILCIDEVSDYLKRLTIKK